MLYYVKNYVFQLKIVTMKKKLFSKEHAKEMQ